VGQTARLTAIAVKKASEKAMLSDGGGLYLQVTSLETKSWIFRFALKGRERQMGLGAYPDVSLLEARDHAARCRAFLREGIDPIEARKGARRKIELEAAKAITFKAAAEGYINAHSAAWKNAKHKAQWSSTLSLYAYPMFGGIPVHQIDVGLVLKAIEPIWTTKTETASRLRGRIESILDWASTRGFREGENPARWRGHLENLLPQKSKVAEVAHHAALPFADLPDFMKALRAEESIAARILEFLILTASRTGEVIGARWSEFNTETTLWTIPADRMKAGKMHRVPLSGRAVQIIQNFKKNSLGEFVFTGGKKDKPLSNMAMLALLKRMERSDITAHGFRSTFRDWVAEKTEFPSELAEMALAHTVTNKVEAAYRRGDMLEKRALLMKNWGLFCQSQLSAHHLVNKAQKAA
jgi:integrase